MADEKKKAELNFTKSTIELIAQTKSDSKIYTKYDGDERTIDSNANKWTVSTDEEANISSKKVQIEGDDEANINSEKINLNATDSIEISGTNEIILKSGTAEIQMSSSGIKLSFGSSTVELSSQGVKINGTMANVEGTTSTTVKGMSLKLDGTMIST